MPKEYSFRSVLSMHKGKSMSFRLSSVDMTETEFQRSNSYISPEFMSSAANHGIFKASSDLEILMALERLNSVQKLKSEQTDYDDIHVIPIPSVTIKYYSMGYGRVHKTYLSVWIPDTLCQQFREMIKIFNANVTNTVLVIMMVEYPYRQ